MKYKSISLIIVLSISGLVACRKHHTAEPYRENMIPKAVTVIPAEGGFELTKESAIYVEGSSPETLKIGQYLADKLNPSTGFDLKVNQSSGSPAAGNIYLSLGADDKEIGDEGYVLTVTEEFVTLKANTHAGLFHGVQSIRQLLPARIESKSRQQGPWVIEAGVIRDFPSYAWRASMLDVARHFFKVEDVKNYIDDISYYKMNVLHLHLSDDQGWRIEIKSWPNLTAIGGTTQVGGGKGGFYTQEQYQEIVAYALDRYITIVPEIDLPGHINAALASYGELNGGTIVPAEGRVKSVLPPAAEDLGKKSKSKPTELYSGIHVGWSTLRAEKEVTFKFIDDVLRELAAITPGPYLHIGGDEAAATKKEDYITFINRFTGMVKAHGKKMIGWEEIAQGNINQEVVTQYWHSSKYALLAAEKGSQIIMSPSRKAYIDMKYDSTTKLGQHWAAYIEVDSAYRWNPATLVVGLNKENILGLEAPLWTETIENMDDIEYMLYPRLPGYAEIGWSKVEGRNWDEYKVRLGKHGARLKAMDINYYHSKLVPWVE